MPSPVKRPVTKVACFVASHQAFYGVRDVVLPFLESVTIKMSALP